MTRKLNFTIEQPHTEQRIDLALSQLMPDISRSQIQKWIKTQSILLNHQKTTPKHIVYQGDIITGEIEDNTQVDYKPQDIDINIIYQDKHIAVINKPVGQIVHPGAGNPDNTLLNSILHHFPSNNQVPRAGIVHRLDKNTSGLMVIAKTIESQFHLVNQLQKRTVKRIYHALVHGQLITGATIKKAIGRSGSNRVKMSISSSGKEAITHYKIIHKYHGLTLIECQLETGRTHQIRVHLANQRNPLVGDNLYGGKNKVTKELPKSHRETILSFNRQALHAKKLTFNHPHTKETVTFKSSLPDDFNTLLLAIKDISYSKETI